MMVAGLYLTTASDHLDGQDQEYYFRMARALAHERTFAIEPLVFQNTEIAGRRGRGDQFYAEYAPGLSVAMVPLIALADVFPNVAYQVQSAYRWMRDRENDVAERIFVSYFDAAVIAATAGVLLLLVSGLGYSEAAGMLVAGVFAFSTFAWGQARTINPEPLQTFFILVAILLALRTNSKNALAAGCALGCAILVKLTAVLAIPALFILVKPVRKSLSSKLLAISSIVLPVLGALA